MSRVNFQTIMARYQSAGKGKVRLTQSNLVLTKPISSATTSYSFDVLDSQTATLQGNEIRLNQNDEFIITHIGLYAQGIANTGATKLFSYAPFENDASQAGTIQALWDGFMKISVNNVVYLDKWATRRHEYVPDYQYRAFVAATAAIGSTGAQIPAFDGLKSGVVPIEPLITLSGAKKSTIELFLPSAITGSTFTNASNGADSYSVVIDRVALVLHGLNAQNGASFQR